MKDGRVRDGGYSHPQNTSRAQALTLPPGIWCRGGVKDGRLKAEVMNGWLRGRVGEEVSMVRGVE